MSDKPTNWRARGSARPAGWISREHTFYRQGARRAFRERVWGAARAGAAREIHGHGHDDAGNDDGDDAARAMEVEGTQPGTHHWDLQWWVPGDLGDLGDLELGGPAKSAITRIRISSGGLIACYTAVWRNESDFTKDSLPSYITRRLLLIWCKAY